MNTAIQILLGALVLILLVWGCLKAIGVWRAEKDHLRRLRDDRKAKEADFPD